MVYRISFISLVSLLFPLLMTCAIPSAEAQQQVSILEADRIVGGTVEGRKVQKILDNVHLRTRELEVFCDSAYQFVNDNEVRAYGNIQINTEEEKIWSDSLVYYTDIDFSQLRGRVIIETDSATLFGNSVDYRFSTKVGHFIDRVRLEDQRGTLLANSGFYYREADSAVFRGQVQLSDTLQYLEGDSLFSNRAKRYYELHGNVFADDRENNTMLKGDYLEADSTGSRLLKGNAWLKNYESDTTAAEPDTAAVTDLPDPDAERFAAEADTAVMIGDTAAANRKRAAAETVRAAAADTTEANGETAAAEADTTHIRAQTIHSEREYHSSSGDTVNIVHAYENVRIWSPDFSAVADTSRYDESTGYFELWSNSIAWHGQVQLTGPYINAKLAGGDIDSLISFPRPFSVQEDTVIDRLNQITGDTLEADFLEGELHRIYVFGNTNLLRFTKDEAGNPDGAIELTAPAVRIFFENGELVEMKAAGQPKGSIDGSYFPENPQTSERTLEGFTWNPDRRPRRPEEKMEPRFLPVPEEPFFELPPRYLQHLEQNRGE